MAARQSLLRPAPPRPELEALLKRAVLTVISDKQLQEQRVSFAYGNAPSHADRITRKSVETTSKRNRLVSA